MVKDLFSWNIISLDLQLSKSSRGLHGGACFNFNGNFNWKRPGVLDLNKKMIVRQEPSSLYDSVWSYASVALVRIDFHPETSEK